ncbi:hypothetical protein CWI38_1607p0020 [Hamiltosporidium tvaerminnensis]|uniref:Alpha/beta hydrolase n=1 Tax=Hamiltosporidium tvaerminnensis TaxID=1176355 RepID=A0A4Q9LQF7_9MICR|nr:hypothetical protein CWI38_1607p0020 [Hamiltosporidium tvaerminnensis]
MGTNRIHIYKKSNKRIYKWLINTFILFVLIIFQLTFILFVFQNKFIYKIKKDDFEISEYTETKYLESKDNNLQLYYINNNSDTDIYVFHGSLVSLKVHQLICKKMCGKKYNLITFFYRGYNKNRGKCNEVNIMIDTYVLYKYVSMCRSKNKKIIFGQSLGCASALYFASLFDKKTDLKIILENPFYDMQSITKNSWFFKIPSFILHEDWPNHLRINNLININLKILFIVSEKDIIVDNQDSYKLMEINKKIKTDIYVLKGATHFDCGKFKEFFITVDNFISKE